MALKWNGDAFLLRIQGAVARGLLAAATELETEHSKRIFTSAGPKSVKRTRDTAAGPKGSRYTTYTNPSRPGGYLHRRTGLGQAALDHEPKSEAEVIAAGLVVKVGYRLQPGVYMTFWESPERGAGRRKGLLQTLDDMRPKLAAIARGQKA